MLKFARRLMIDSKNQRFSGFHALKRLKTKMTPLVPQQSRLKKFSDTTVVLSKINGNTLSELPDISSSSNQNETVVPIRATTRRRKTRLMSPRNPHIRKIFELKLKMGQQRKLS